jgi:hypothetical protein
MATELRQGLNGIGCLRGEDHICLRSNDCPQTLPENRMVFDAQDANWLATHPEDPHGDHCRGLSFSLKAKA